MKAPPTGERRSLSGRAPGVAMLRFIFLLSALLALSGPASAQFGNHSVPLNLPSLANEYYTVANHDSLQNLTAITIEAWVRPTSFAGFPTIVGNDYTNSYWLGLSTSGKLRFYPNGGVFVESTNALTLDRWTHVAATYDSDNGFALLYVDGEVAGARSGFSGSTGGNLGDLRIGADRQGGNPAFFWRGNLDEVRIWRSARSLADLAADRYARGPLGGDAFGPSTHYATLETFWHSNADGSGIWHDVMSGHDAFPVNSPIPNDNEAPALDFCTAGVFDGVDDFVQIGLPLPDLSAGVTVEAWIYPESDAFPTIIGRDFQTGTWLGLSTIGRLRFYPRGGQYVDGNSTVPLNRWTHVAGVYRDGLTRLLVNGEVDKISYDINGPVPNNGKLFRIGADNLPPGGFTFPFRGRIDEARITGGPRSPRQIREDMFFTRCRFGSSEVVDEDGVPRDFLPVHFTECEDAPVYHGDSYFGASGAPLFSPFSGEDYSRQLDGIYMKYTGVEVSGTNPAAFEETLSIPQNVPITDLDVFVNLEFHRDDSDFIGLFVQLLPPFGGPNFTLFNAAPAQSRNLQTMFDDASPWTIAGSRSPFNLGVRPVDPLSLLNGQMSGGTWRLRVTPGAGQVRCRLNQWGIRLNRMATLAVGEPAAPGEVELALAGGQPVTHSARFEYAMPSQGDMVLAIYDALGRRVQVVERGHRPAGRHTVEWGTGAAAPGIYFARLAVQGMPARALRLVVVKR